MLCNPNEMRLEERAIASSLLNRTELEGRAFAKQSGEVANEPWMVGMLVVPLIVQIVAEHSKDFYTFNFLIY